jgi:thiol-disulfide isomerase/thioredoxin
MKTLTLILAYLLLNSSCFGQFTPYDSVFLGKDVYKIELFDTAGNITTLEKFRGKYLYVDFWFTGCKPCIAEIPSFKKLKAKLDRKDVVFVTISIDPTESMWLETIRKHNIDGEHFWTGRDLSYGMLKDEFKIVSFPFYWIVDPEGKIINPNADRPSKFLENGKFLTFINNGR